jgi:methylenetetrahydrofolate reductase (NADPH)
MISFELVARNLESIKKQCDFLNTTNIFNAVNVPYMIRFDIRSWEVKIPIDFDFIPHIRIIDFDLNKNNLFEIIENYKLKQVLLITGEKPCDFSKNVFNSNILTVIELLKKKFPKLIISVAIDQYRTSLKEEIQYTNDKLNAGADYIFSQPFFDINYIETFFNYIEPSKLFIGISPVVTEKSKNYWENKNNVIFPKNFDTSYIR